jgi:pyruvate formate lyase activating enzyme
MVTQGWTGDTKSVAIRPPAVSPGPLGRPNGLRVGGLTPLTTVDYPGELAAVVFCQGCPFRCPYCHNGHLIPARGEDLIPWGRVLEFLQVRRGLLDAVVFSGGEPTLQSGLGAAMAETRGLGFKVGLHTAGPYPGRLRRVLHLVDWVGLDIKALPEEYARVTGVRGSGERAWESLELLLAAGVDLEVRTTPLPGMNGPEDTEALTRRLLQAGVWEHRIQTCRTEHMLDPRCLGISSMENRLS